MEAEVNPTSPFVGFDDPRVRMYLEALAGLHGDRPAWSPTRSAKVAGVSHTHPTYWRKALDGFLPAERQAMTMGAEVLREAARVRAVEGTRRYFHDKEGNPLLNPDVCDGCGHGRREHVTADGVPGPKAFGVEALCSTGCGCVKFTPAPYTEQVVSDKLLEKLLAAGLPEEFAERKRVEVMGTLKRIDVARLPHDIMARVAAGEPLELLIAELVLRGMAVPLRPEPAQLGAGEIVVPAQGVGGGGQATSEGSGQQG